MKKLRTHYDNLKVSRDAPIEVIRAAYRSLSQKYHPDKNNDSEESIRIMRIINDSYDVLSNPGTRLSHDEWIRKSENPLNDSTVEFHRNYNFYDVNRSHVHQKTKEPEKSADSHPIRKAFTLSLIPFSLLFLLKAVDVYRDKQDLPLLDKQIPRDSLGSNNKPPVMTTDPAEENWWDAYPEATEESVGLHSKASVKGEQDIGADPVPTRVKYSKPDTAPNGAYWPQVASYIPGYPILRRDGLSTVTIDNTQNDSEVFLKLVSIEGNSYIDARLIYIPGNQKFEFDAVSKGAYEIRYKDLETGSYAKSPSFFVEENRTSTGTEFSEIRLTLYTIANGNMTLETISESEF